MENIEINKIPDLVESVDKKNDIFTNLVNREGLSDFFVEQKEDMFRVDLEAKQWSNTDVEKCGDICNGYLV